MTDKEIKDLAIAITEAMEGENAPAYIIDSRAVRTENVLRELTKDFCIVPKNKVGEEYQSAKRGWRMATQMAGQKFFNDGRMTAIESLSPSRFNQNEKQDE